MTKEEAVKFFAEFYGGEHRMRNEVKPFGIGWYCLHAGDLATYDSATLTKLVVMAHDKAYRVEVAPSVTELGVVIAIHKRSHDAESLFDRHPTLEQAIETARSDK